MNMKAIMFAGVGLFASMSATAIWVGGDMADIKAREAAKRAAECAQLAPSGTAPVTGVPTTADPSAALATDPATTAATNPDCASGGDPAAGLPATDPALDGQVDPETGQPLVTLDPATANAPVDPGTGLTAPANDPATAVTEFVDPNAVPATAVPASEMPPVDPAADPGVTGTGDGTTF